LPGVRLEGGARPQPVSKCADTAKGDELTGPDFAQLKDNAIGGVGVALNDDPPAPHPLERARDLRLRDDRHQPEHQRETHGEPSAAEVTIKLTGPTTPMNYDNQTRLMGLMQRRPVTGDGGVATSSACK
jgi:hypothetical protein